MQVVGTPLEKLQQNIGKPSVSARLGFIFVGLCVLCSLSIIWIAADPGWAFSDHSLSVVLILGGGIIALMAAAVFPPIVPLTLAVIFAESPLSTAMDNQYSAYLVTALLMWAVAAKVFSTNTSTFNYRNPLLKIVWLFAIYGVLSGLRGFFLGNPTNYVLGDLFQVEEFTLVFIVVHYVITDKETLRRFLTFAFSSTLVSVFWQLGLAARGAGPDQGLAYWESSEFGSALPRTINLTVIYVIVVLLALRPFVKSNRLRLVVYLLIFISLGNIVMSLTRGVWVGSLIALLVCVGLVTGEQRPKFLKALAIAGVCLLVAAGAWSAVRGGENANLIGAVKERIVAGLAQLEDARQGEVEVGTRRFVEVWNMTSQVLPSPLLGRGLGALFILDASAYFGPESEGVIDWHYIHNLYLLILFRMGLLGLSLYIWMLFTYFRETMAFCSRLPSGPTRALTAALIAGVAGQAVLSVTSPTLLNHPTSVLAASVMALTFQLRNQEVSV